MTAGTGESVRCRRAVRWEPGRSAPEQLKNSCPRNQNAGTGANQLLRCHPAWYNSTLSAHTKYMLILITELSSPAHILSILLALRSPFPDASRTAFPSPTALCNLPQRVLTLPHRFLFLYISPMFQKVKGEFYLVITSTGTSKIFATFRIVSI